MVSGTFIYFFICPINGIVKQTNLIDFMLFKMGNLTVFTNLLPPWNRIKFTWTINPVGTIRARNFPIFCFKETFQKSNFFKKHEYLRNFVRWVKFLLNLWVRFGRVVTRVDRIKSDWLLSFRFESRNGWYILYA